jgi:NAD(P)-dependent dehydrogenase (short-subunit alcohol dehydrogenase family)
MTRAADRLAGRRAVVTGGGSGVGRAVALQLIHEGASVTVLDIRSEAAELVAAEISTQGGVATAVQADVGDEASISAAIVDAAAALGGLDTVVACAGVALPGATAEMSIELWNTILRVNLTGVFLTVKHALPHLQQAGGGAIVTVGSVASLVAAGGTSAYEASKGGVLQFTRGVAVEFADHGIRANCVCPGVVATDLRANSREVAGVANVSGSRRSGSDRIDVPMSRACDPNEVATAIAFLCSDEASFITGIALPVDGGFTAV